MKTKKRGKPSMRQTKKNIRHSLPEEHIINGYHIFLYPYPNKTTYVEMVTNNGFISETKAPAGNATPAHVVFVGGFISETKAPARNATRRHNVFLKGVCNRRQHEA